MQGRGTGFILEWLPSLSLGVVPGACHLGFVGMPLFREAGLHLSLQLAYCVALAGSPASVSLSFPDYRKELNQMISKILLYSNMLWF